MHNIAVIGAGVIGIATAINIQRKLPGAKVRIIAEKFDQDTTSWGAGGIFRPTAKHLQGVDPERLRKWLRNGWDFYSTLATSEQAGESGMQIVSGYILYNEEPKGLLYPDIVYHHRQMLKEEMELLNFGQYRYGYDVTTIITSPKTYYKWLLKRFVEKGGEIDQRKVSDLNEFVDNYDVVVNCTGLGSKDLIGDSSVYPVRGQLVRVHAPWIKTFVYTDNDTYIYPKIKRKPKIRDWSVTSMTSGCCSLADMFILVTKSVRSTDIRHVISNGFKRPLVLWIWSTPALTENSVSAPGYVAYTEGSENLLALGGCRQKDNFNLSNTKEDTERILHSCYELFPALKGAQIDNVWTGLRPTRDPPRVEKEIIKFPNGRLKVVHNYGHGANGITLSWGVGLEAADLVASFLNYQSKL